MCSSSATSRRCFWQLLQTCPTELIFVAPFRENFPNFQAAKSKLYQAWRQAAANCSLRVALWRHQRSGRTGNGESNANGLGAPVGREQKNGLELVCWPCVWQCVANVGLMSVPFFCWPPLCAPCGPCGRPAVSLWRRQSERGDDFSPR